MGEPTTGPAAVARASLSPSMRSMLLRLDSEPTPSPEGPAGSLRGLLMRGLVYVSTDESYQTTVLGAQVVTILRKEIADLGEWEARQAPAEPTAEAPAEFRIELYAALDAHLEHSHGWYDDGDDPTHPFGGWVDTNSEALADALWKAGWRVPLPTPVDVTTFGAAKSSRLGTTEYLCDRNPHPEQIPCDRCEPL